MRMIVSREDTTRRGTTSAENQSRMLRLRTVLIDRSRPWEQKCLSIPYLSTNAADYTNEPKPLRDNHPQPPCSRFRFCWVLLVVCIADVHVTLKKDLGLCVCRVKASCMREYCVYLWSATTSPKPLTIGSREKWPRSKLAAARVEKEVVTEMLEMITRRNTPSPRLWVEKT